MTDTPDAPSRSARSTAIQIAGTLLTITLGVALAWLGSQGGAEVDAIPIFAAAVAFAFALNWAVFIPSFVRHTERYFDLTGSLTYISVTVGALLLAPNPDFRAWLVGLMVVIWAVRLGSFLYRRIANDGRDGRFDQMKYNFWQYLLTWTLQGLWVSLTAAAALIIITSATGEPFGVLGLIGLVVWIAGFATEVVADTQKSRFKANPANAGRFIDSGLWAWSRHPNYFGEIVLWAGIAIMAIPVLSGWRWVALISPVFVFVLLTRISGIPLLARRAEARWGSEASYRRYVERTSLLVPLPPRRPNSGWSQS
ncbi:MAG: DUF1295 domain-containing protein [Actinomycetota bacterium]